MDAMQNSKDYKTILKSIYWKMSIVSKPVIHIILTKDD